LQRIRRSLGYAFLILITLAAYPEFAYAQSAMGYATGGPSAVRNIGIRDEAWQVGAGGELLKGPFGFGGQIDYVHFPEVTKISNGRITASSPAASAVGVSATASYHFGGTAVERRTRPFATAGVTGLAGDEVSPILLQLAAGVDWWASERAGLRLEVRGQAPSMLGVRVGFVFR
jgi:hypothetical protein